MITLDASVLIAQLDAGDVHHAAAVQVLEASAGEPYGASVMTLAEVLVSYAAQDRTGHGQALLDDLEVAEVPLGRTAAPRLAALRATTGLRLPDCCVLLAAQDAGADTIATFDDRLAEAARTLGFAVAGAP